MNIDNLEKILEGQPKYRLAQAKEAVLKNFISNWDQATFFTKELRDKLEESVGTRLEGMNEFRHQLDKQAGTFVTWPGLFAVSTTVALVVFGAMELLIRLVLSNPTK